jgi:hypothetical protein
MIAYHHCHVKKLTGKLVSLAPIGPECAQMWCEWLNDLDVARIQRIVS